jgi:hypothetical protein
MRPTTNVAGHWQLLLRRVGHARASWLVRRGVSAPEGGQRPDAAAGREEEPSRRPHWPPRFVSIVRPGGLLKGAWLQPDDDVWMQPGVKGHLPASILRPYQGRVAGPTKMLYYVFLFLFLSKHQMLHYAMRM